MNFKVAPGTAIFIREKRDAKFLSREGRSVLALCDAMMFASTWDALVYCLAGSIHKAEIVMRMGEPRYDVTLAIR